MHSSNLSYSSQYSVGERRQRWLWRADELVTEWVSLIGMDNIGLLTCDIWCDHCEHSDAQGFAPLNHQTLTDVTAILQAVGLLQVTSRKVMQETILIAHFLKPDICAYPWRKCLVRDPPQCPAVLPLAATGRQSPSTVPAVRCLG